MDWRSCAGCVLLVAVLLIVLPHTHCWSTTWNGAAAAAAASSGRQRNEVSPYLDLALCPIRPEPWSCARQQSARILDVWDGELHSQWQKLKVEADRQLNATIEKRGYSASEVMIKEKPSTILKKIEIGTDFMKEYLAETMDGFLGREYEYMQKTKSQESEDNDDDDDDEDEDGDDEEEQDTAAAAAEAEEEEDNDDDDADGDQVESENAVENNENTETDQDEDSKNTGSSSSGGNVAATDDNNTSNGDEFFEIEDAEKNGQLKRPGFGGGGGNKGGGNKQKRRKKKKKGQKGQQHAGQVAQPATLLVVQQHDPHAISDAHEEISSFGGGEVSSGHGHGGKPQKQKQKRRKRKKHQHGGGGAEESLSTVVLEQVPASGGHFGFDVLEELVAGDDLLSGGGGKRKKGHPSKYGRSNGVTRGKKKKKKKALMKLVLLGSFLKAKIELLLKILGAHLQIKFFAIALIGLLINIARFWIDVKRGGAPQKVVYVEHAHHQHHYEDAHEDWGGGESSGSYWKRSLQTDPTVDESGGGTAGSSSSTDSYLLRPQQQDPHYMAYRNQWQ